MDSVVIAIIAAVFGSAGFWSLVIFLLTRYYNNKDGRAAQQQAFKDALLAVLHDRVYQICAEHLKRGKLSTDEMKNLEYLYNSYKELGGNGTAAELFERCKKLNIED